MEECSAMTNGKSMGKYRSFIMALIFVLATGPFSMTLWAGNKEHVEQRVEDIDQLNKDIIKEFPDIPQYGTIEYKAHVKEGENGPKVKIIEKTIETGPRTEDIEKKNP